MDAVDHGTGDPDMPHTYTFEAAGPAVAALTL
jgi:hypothetical protein